MQDNIGKGWSKCPTPTTSCSWGSNVHLPLLTRPGNNSQFSGIPGFDSKIFCESTLLTTLETASNMPKNAEFYEAELL